MKKYISPEIEITRFITEDIITVSSTVNVTFNDVQGEAPSGVTFDDVWPPQYLD
ncbi:MAG: hypothetical protein IJZ47_12125 [Oscillospiraceae bacterium]|nr:hypothetical protein [Oscillospiraceae bacterium]